MTSANPTDPSQIRLTGENSFIRLMDDSGQNQTTRASHWRVLYSPVGGGHVLFLKSDLIGSDVRIWADNIALARWLQDEIESQLFPEFANLDIPVVDAEFTKKGDTFSYWTETIDNDDDLVTLTWHDFLEPFMLVVPAGASPERPHGVYSCFIPARQAQVTIDGDVAQGDILLENRGDKGSSSACLAWSETWVRPEP